MQWLMRKSVPAIALVWLALAGLVRPAEAAAPPVRNNRHAVGLSLDLSLLAAGESDSRGGFTGFAYRRYFDDTALQVNALPIYLDRGNDLAMFAGVQVIHYALVWAGHHRGGLLASSSALRLTGGASVHASRRTTEISVPDENCQNTTCQQITQSRAAVRLSGSVAAGLGVELGAVQQAGFTVSGDLLMTVIWDDKGFYGAYPLPYVSAMYAW